MWAQNLSILNFFSLGTYLTAGLSQGGGGSWSPLPQFLAEQLTLSQPGEQIMPTKPPDFQNFLRPWYLPK